MNIAGSQVVRLNMQLRAERCFESTLRALEKGQSPCPSLTDLANILNKCRLSQNRNYAERLYVYMRANGLDAHSNFTGILFRMLVDVGSIDNAQKVFDNVTTRNERTWNMLIRGYIKSGLPQHAYMIYDRMLNDESVHPNGHTFVALFKACTILKDLNQSAMIHAEAARMGLLEKDPYVGTAMMDMYVKLGLLSIAHQVLQKLPVRNVVTWTTLIAGYVDHGFGEMAFECFEQMQLDGVHPDSVTFVCCLKACVNIGSLDKGCKISAEIERQGLLGKDLLVTNSVIDMYAKCGSIIRAQQLFDKFSVRDEFSWTALISGYVENGQGEKALNCFEQMQDDQISPDGIMFIWVLKACISVQDIEKGHHMHAEIEKRGLLETDVMVGNSLVDMYAKCGLYAVAHNVFDRLPIRNVVSWNALMEGFTECGNGPEILKCLEKMHTEGVSADNVTYIFCLKACGCMRDIEKGEHFHIEIERKGFLHKDLVLGNALIDMYVKCGYMSTARRVFDKLVVRNIVTWNTLIEGYVENGMGRKALECLDQMKFDGIDLDAITFVCVLKACSSVGAIDIGREIHEEIEKQDLLRENLVVANALIDMYAKCGCLGKAQDVFDSLVVRDVISWNSLITGYVEHGRNNEAIDCFGKMKEIGVIPDSVTYICALKACGTQGAATKGGEIHAEIEQKGLLGGHVFIGSALIDMYARCGSLSKAQHVFDKLPARSTVPWNSLMGGYAQLGESYMVLHMFEKMLTEGAMPNPITFVVLLNSCSRAGLFNKGQSYFEAMSKDYGIRPAVEHQSCLIDSLCRAGQLEKAMAMVKKMPYSPDLVVWHIILNACKNWGNIKFGQQAFGYARQLDETDSSAYAMMAQICGNG